MSDELAKARYLKWMRSVSILELMSVTGVSREDAKAIKYDFNCTRRQAIKIRSHFDFMDCQRNHEDILSQEQVEKFIAIFLYVTAEIGAKPHVGKLVLSKILYFIESDYFEQCGQSIIGLTYMRTGTGAIPLEFESLVQCMIQKDLIEEIETPNFSFQKVKYLPLVHPDMSSLSGEDLQIIRSVIYRYGEYEEDHLCELSNLDAPCELTERQCIIDMKSVSSRTAVFQAPRMYSLKYNCITF